MSTSPLKNIAYYLDQKIHFALAPILLVKLPHMLKYLLRIFDNNHFDECLNQIHIQKLSPLFPLSTPNNLQRLHILRNSSLDTKGTQHCIYHLDLK